MASKLQIVNRALTSFGHRRIISLTADNEAARTVNSIYDSLLDEVLESSNWNFARVTAALVQVRAVTDPNDTQIGSWAYIYNKPINCLKLRKVYAQGHRYTLDTMQPNFAEINDNNQEVIGSDINGAYCEYTMRVMDTSAYTAAFCACLSAGIAAEVCMPLTQRADLALSMVKVYMTKLGEAERKNSERDFDKDQPSGGYIDARGGGRRHCR